MKHSILGIDLATRRYRDIGIAIVQEDARQINSEIKRQLECKFLRPSEYSPSEYKLDRSAEMQNGELWLDPPTVERFADYIFTVATQYEVSVIAIDGPQAWKSPENGLQHQRLSEKSLHTQAKTGLPGTCKPATSLRFVNFAIEFYAALEARGWKRQMSAAATAEKCVIEVFPTAAWRALGLKPLPAKAASVAETVTQWLQHLHAHFPLKLETDPNHDELQALMAGLVGLAFAQNNGYSSLGSAPFLLQGQWREGFIVNFA